MKGGEADEHLFSGRAGEIDCSRDDGMLFTDGEPIYDLLFYTESEPSSPSLCTQSVRQAWMSVRRGRAYLPALPSRQGNKEKKKTSML